jgi:hypothetical protein
MIYTSLAVLALAAASSFPQLPKVVHLHPQPEARVTVTLRNPTNFFEDVKIGDRTFTVRAHQGLTIKAPVGTLVLADGPNGFHKRGEVLVQLEAALDKTAITLR